MPNRESDPKANMKKRHIGNDFVAIVYNNSGGRYKLGTVKGQFIYACVVIVPLDQGSNKVFVDCRPELIEPLGHVRVSSRVAKHFDFSNSLKLSAGSKNCFGQKFVCPGQTAGAAL